MPYSAKHSTSIPPRGSWDIAFHSGMSADGDMRAAIEAKAPLGVVATLLSPLQKLRTIPNYLDQGGMVFVDSGAFNAFRARVPVDWNRVTATYDTLLGMSTTVTGLSLVAPDVVGDQEGTLSLWRDFSCKIREWIDAGARVIVPLQIGDLPASSMLEMAKAIFERENFCAGIPSNLAAMGPDECMTLRHHDFHVLGRVVMTPELRDKMTALLLNNPDATYTADANWLRARTQKIARGRLAASPMGYGQGESRFSRRTQTVIQLLAQEGYHSGSDRGATWVA